MAKKTPPLSTDLKQRPFAALLKAKAPEGGANPGTSLDAPRASPDAPSGPRASPDALGAEVSPQVPAAAARIPRAVVRYERKGRGGKEVTVVEKLGLGEHALVDWLKALKQSLGTGGAVEGDTLVLQGDQRARIGGLLAARGVAKVTIA